MANVTRPEVGPGVSLYQDVFTGRCARCRDAEEAEKANRRLAMQQATDGIAPFPPLTQEDLGLRPSAPLPKPGPGNIRFDGVYERTLAGYPGGPGAHVVRVVADGRMFSGNYGTIGTWNIQTAGMDHADIARHLADHADTVTVEISGGHLSWGSFPGAHIMGWIDTNHALVLETISVAGGKRGRTAGIYQFVAVDDLLPPGQKLGSHAALGRSIRRPDRVARDHSVVVSGMVDNTADRFARAKRRREADEQERSLARAAAAKAAARSELVHLMEEIQGEGRLAVSRLMALPDHGNPELETVLTERHRLFRSSGPKQGHPQSPSSSVLTRADARVLALENGRW